MLERTEIVELKFNREIDRKVENLRNGKGKGAF